MSAVSELDYLQYEDVVKNCRRVYDTCTQKEKLVYCYFDGLVWVCVRYFKNGQINPRWQGIDNQYGMGYFIRYEMYVL